jgi:hypothetical protein
MGEPVAKKKTYEKPSIKELTLEQAKLTLIGETTLGSQDAHDLLKIMFSNMPSKETKMAVGKSQ